MSTGDTSLPDFNTSEINAELKQAADSTKLDATRIENQRKLALIRSQRADLDPLGVFSKRLELLISCVWPEDSPYRILFELEYESEMSKVLDQALAEVRKARLSATTPVTTPNGSGLIIPKG
jgi:hypothetical protein